MKLVVKRTKDGNRELPYWADKIDTLTVETTRGSILISDRGYNRIALNKKEANRLASTILKLAKLLE